MVKKEESIESIYNLLRVLDTIEDSSKEDIQSVVDSCNSHRNRLINEINKPYNQIQNYEGFRVRDRVRFNKEYFKPGSGLTDSHQYLFNGNHKMKEAKRKHRIKSMAIAKEGCVVATLDNGISANISWLERLSGERK